MPTPRAGETREQMNERRRREGMPKAGNPMQPIITLKEAAERWPEPEYVPNFQRGKWSPGTGKVYEIAWRHWDTYCRKEGHTPLPARAEHVAAFLHEHASAHATSTVSQALAAIRAIHKDAKGQLAKTDPHREMYLLDDPIIEDAWAEIRRQKGTANQKKEALSTKDIKRLIGKIPEDNYLDHALLLIGFASAMRRSEIVALNLDDFAFSDDGLLITIRRSKTDKSGKGVTVAIERRNNEFCPVMALERWIEHRGITSGAVFINRFGERMVGSTVAWKVKHWGALCGFDPRLLGAHSLRRGCITSMFKAGADLKSIMTHSRHTTPSIALGYVQAEKALENPAVRVLGL